MKSLTSRLRRKNLPTNSRSIDKSEKNEETHQMRVRSNVDRASIEGKVYYSDASSTNSTPTSTPKMKKKFLSGKVVLSLSPGSDRKSNSSPIAMTPSPVSSRGKMYKSKSMDRARISMSSHADGTSFASCNSLKSLDRSMTSQNSDASFEKYLSSLPGGKSLNDSFTSLSLGSSPTASTLSLSMNSNQFHLSLTEEQLNEEMKPRAKTSTSSKLQTLTSGAWKKHRPNFRLPFRRPKLNDKRRCSNGDCYQNEPIKHNGSRSQSMCVGDISEAAEMLEKFKEDNDALVMEVRGKDEELRLLNATMDQVNQTWENKVKALMRDVETANRKNEHLRTFIAKETAAAQANAQKPVVRVPVSDPRKPPLTPTTPSDTPTDNVSYRGIDDNPAKSALNEKTMASPPAKRRGVREAPRRMAVTARPCGKTDEVKEKLLQTLSSSKCLSQLSRDDLKTIVDVMKCKRINKGERLMQEGNMGQAFYVLADGDCRIYKQNQETVSPNVSEGGKPVAQWELFGDADVFYHTRRVWSCKCVRQGMVWYITRDEFRSAVMQQDFHRRKKEIFTFLKRVKAFQNLNVTKFRALANVARVEHYAYGDYIIRQGGSPKSVYVIKEGEVTVTRQIDGTETPQKTLSPGHIFGDVTNSLRHQNNVVAAGTDLVQCVAIPMKQFDLARDHLTSSSDDVTAKNVHASLATRRLLGDGRESLSSGSGYTTSSGYGSDTSSPDSRRKIYQRHYHGKHRAAFIEKANQLHGRDRRDFDFVATIGNGAFGSVDLVSSKTDETDVFAIKKLSKQEIVASEQQQNVFSEKSIQTMTSQECPFIVSLYSTFKDNRYVYFVMEFCPGGELFSLLSNARSFDDITARFYTGCVIEALSFLHAKHVVFRDLKPENVVIDQRGYCKLTDFGFAKKVSAASSLRTYTYCGTPEYMAPEIILYHAQTFSVDLWCLGVFIYEILVGKAPFRNANREHLAESILKGIEPKLKDAKEAGRINSQASLLISQLCHMRPEERLGSGKNGFAEVAKHSWFNKLDWNGLRHRTLQAPWKPLLKSTHDLRYFDTFSKTKTHSHASEEFSGWDENF